MTPMGNWEDDSEVNRCSDNFVIIGFLYESETM